MRSIQSDLVWRRMPRRLGSALSTVTLGVPTGTTSGTPVMMGLGASCKITPQSTGRVDFRIRGTFGNSAANITGIVGFRFDTGTAPANGVAATGTSAGETPNSLPPMPRVQLWLRHWSGPDGSNYGHSVLVRCHGTGQCGGFSNERP